MKPMRRIFYLIIVCPCLVLAEPRQLVDENSPDWLYSVGRLTIPGLRYESGDALHQQENCSASLISERLVLTAWHCLENYRNLAQDIVFTLPQLPGKPQRTARRVADGGGMQADWALLKLQSSIAGAQPIPVNDERTNVSPVLSLAGYSRDEGLGKGGENLTWQTDCHITADETYRVATNCLAYKGASGGPVLQQGSVVGVISAGDATELTYYAPSRSFRAALRRYL